jgi:hypothetical protein
MKLVHYSAAGRAQTLLRRLIAERHPDVEAQRRVNALRDEVIWMIREALERTNV